MLTLSLPCLHRIYDKRTDPALDISTTVAASADGKSAVVYDFDQIDRHRKFWDYLRNKEWQAVATFFDKKVTLNSGLQEVGIEWVWYNFSTLHA